MQKTRGFTIVELMIALAVAAVLLAVGVPAFRDFIVNNRRAAQVNEFVTALNLARSEAIKRSNNVVLCRTNDPTATPPVCGAGNGYEEGWIVFEDSDGDDAYDAGEPLIRVHTGFDAGATLRGNAPLNNRVRFTQLGGAPNFGTIRYCDARGAGPEARQIAVSIQGRVMTQEGSPSCP